MSIQTFYRHSFSLLFIISLLMMTTACDKELDQIDDKTVIKKLSFQEEELIQSTNNLSLRILSAELQRNSLANYFFSPVSTNMALGMVYNVVGEKEKSEILHNTGLEYLEENEINKTYNELLSFLNTSKIHTKLTYANSMWFSPTFDINENFRTTVMAYYDAEVEELNFKRNAASETINRWGNLKTRGKFEKLVDHSLPENSNLVLINAFGLNTSWSKTNNFFYSKTKFTGTNGKTSEVSAINFDGIDIAINSTNDFDYYEFPFEDKTYTFSMIVPFESENIRELTESLTAEDLKNLRDNAYLQKINFSLPEINFQGDKSMKSALSLIGLSGIFAENADLTPSFPESKKPDRIDDINQKTQILLSKPVMQIGQKTSFSDMQLEKPDINRPFVYFVRDKLTKTVLFAGYFVTPENN